MTGVLKQLWRKLEALGLLLLGLVGISAPTARQIVRFCVVGAFSVGTYVAVMSLMVAVLGTSIVIGSIFAFIIGTSVSYAGNALWSFDATPSPRNATRFLVITSIGLLLNMAIAWVGERMGLDHLLVSAIVIIVVPTFNFIGHRLVTFARTRHHQ